MGLSPPRKREDRRRLYEQSAGWWRRHKGGEKALSCQRRENSDMAQNRVYMIKRGDFTPFLREGEDDVPGVGKAKAYRTED